VTQETLPPPATVNGPGVYLLPAEEYHADPVPGGSLSSTGVRKLLAPSCPALFRHWLDNPTPTSETFDIGSAAHQLVLGAGPKLVLIEAEEWRTNAVKAEVAAVREAGAIPLRPSTWDAVHGMAAALAEHPFAGKLFQPGTGRPERTLIWQETATLVNPEPLAEGEMHAVPVRCRALVDWLPESVWGGLPGPGRRVILPDYKSTASAAPADVEKAIARYGYHIQLAWYLRGLRALGLADERAEGVLVMQEKTPPYLVTVVQPDATAMRMADIRIREALDIYAECTATGRWPGYADDVVPVSLPPWETKELNGEIW
jgi:hypothetical protein